jgi:hypothetical protein
MRKELSQFRVIQPSGPWASLYPTAADPQVPRCLDLAQRATKLPQEDSEKLSPDKGREGLLVLEGRAAPQGGVMTDQCRLRRSHDQPMTRTCGDAHRRGRLQGDT